MPTLFKLPKSFFACHGPISIPTLTVMAVAADFHRRFLIPERHKPPDNGVISPQ